MELKAELIIEVPAREAWVVLGECWAHIGHWAAPITASFVDGPLRPGTVRTCHTARFGPVAPGLIKERLLAFDASAFSLTYEAAAGMPRFIARAVNQWSVHPLDDGRCLVRTHAKLTLRGPMALFTFLLERSFAANGARVLEELKHRVEHGLPHPRKLAALEREPPAPELAAASAGIC